MCLKAEIIVVDNINKFIDIIGMDLTNQLVLSLSRIKLSLVVHDLYMNV